MKSAPDLPGMSTCATPAAQPQTELDRFADAFGEGLARADPYFALDAGLPLAPAEPRFRDYSPDGEEDITNWMTRRKRELLSIRVTDSYDAFTRAEILAVIEQQQASHSLGLHLKNLNVVDSPLQRIYECLSFMPTGTDLDREHGFELLSKVPEALDRYRESLEEGVATGRGPARTQIIAAAQQSAKLSQRSGFFHDIATNFAKDEPARSLALESVRNAEAAYGEFSDFLRAELAPRASDIESCGRDEHELRIDHFVGAQVDVEDSYLWALDQLGEVSDEMNRVARAIQPGTTLPELLDDLRADRLQRLSTLGEAQDWVAEVLSRVTSGLLGREFDDRLRTATLEVALAPVSGTGIYYLAPRAGESTGRLVWPPEEDGQLDVVKWRDLTTVVHEGVPGHHLQMGMTTASGAHRNVWRAKAPGSAGNSEGWAVYAESLVDTAGVFPTPAYRLGYLNSQRLRLVRLVLDVGIHSGLGHPNGGAWSRQRASQFLREHVTLPDRLLAHELDRYFGWPGQASAYKLGERFWWETRKAFLQSNPAGSPIEFHDKALSLGGGRLDTVRRALNLE